MCHDAMEVNLNPNVNFVVGRNGSGKSAILTALMIGLGGRAKITNRGDSIKGAYTKTMLHYFLSTKNILNFTKRIKIVF